VIGLVFALIGTLIIPVAVMAALEPSLYKSAPRVENYRGRMVYNGLGIVWFVWLAAFWIGVQLLAALGLELPYWAEYLKPLSVVLAGACAFGMFDDWAGDRQITGFSGHLRAMLRGHITTGGLKFLGIGFLSLFLAVSLYFDGAGSIPKVLLVTCVVALGANTMNLFDLRPGRAGKMYLLGLVFAFACIIFGGVLTAFDWQGLVALALAALGPLVAVWRFDLRERGMLGDAGANPLGVFLGFLCASSLPLWALTIVAVALVAVNLLSERVSFTKIIAGNRLLSALDELGRVKNTQQAELFDQEVGR